MSNTKADPGPVPSELAPPQTSQNTTPRFSHSAVSVVFILGGPGSGKGTQSANLVRDYGFTHLSAGDLLRAEQNRPGSQYGDLIKSYIRDGKIVPMEITVALLSNAMAEALEKQGLSGSAPAEKKARFLIDGFPRKLDQAVFFENTVCLSEFTLFLNCPEDVMEKRLMKRGETSGRDDDNAESIRKRFRVFVDTSMPVVDAFEKQGKVVSVEATGTVDEVYSHVKEGIHARGIHPA